MDILSVLQMIACVAPGPWRHELAIEGDVIYCRDAEQAEQLFAMYRALQSSWHFGGVVTGHPKRENRRALLINRRGDADSL